MVAIAMWFSKRHCIWNEGLGQYNEISILHKDDMRINTFYKALIKGKNTYNLVKFFAHKTSHFP